MSIEIVTVAAVKWLWESYGKEFSETTADKLKDRWTQFKWRDAEQKYRNRLREFSSTVRVLGNPKPINLDEIFTDVYVLDKPTAFRRFNIQELQASQSDVDALQASSEKRKPALSLVSKKKRLFILGKPGAGKTTFLKYLVLNAIDGKTLRTPIFVSLREWADTSLELLDFIAEQFEICSFPDPKAFILHLLSSGNALVLFDGLDEINIEQNQRAQMISSLTNFAKRYPDVHICLTCRIAATDYSFDQFTYLEIADFDKKQQDTFVSRWFQDNKRNLERFQSEFSKSENKGLRDLARTPLLLTLLCLAFDETLSFPNRRVDLYKESIDALLKKWDSSRGIKRDEVYRKLSPARKEQMLARIAAENFETGSYFVEQEKLEKQIKKYLQQLPDTEGGYPDGDVILKAMEAQHGILVERAHQIYSFSHLTFQEYLTARYIIENVANGTIERLIRAHVYDDRWREVFLLSASMLDNADKFFDVFLRELSKILDKQQNTARFFRWALKKAKSVKSDDDNVLKDFPSNVMLELVLIFPDEFYFPDEEEKGPFSKPNEQQISVFSKNIGFRYSRGMLAEAPGFDFDIVRFLTNSLVNSMRRVKATGETKRPTNIDRLSKKVGLEKLAEIIGVKLSRQDLTPKKNLSRSDLLTIQRYMKTFELFLSCLKLASVSDRKHIEEQLILTIPAGYRLTAVSRDKPQEDQK